MKNAVAKERIVNKSIASEISVERGVSTFNALICSIILRSWSVIIASRSIMRSPSSSLMETGGVALAALSLSLSVSIAS